MRRPIGTCWSRPARIKCRAWPLEIPTRLASCLRDSTRKISNLENQMSSKLINPQIFALYRLEASMRSGVARTDFRAVA